MKNLFLFLSFLLLLSCSVQKRKYQKGFYVERNHKKSRTVNTASKKEIKVKDDKHFVESTESVVNAQTNTLADTRKLIVINLKKKFSFLQALEDSCDLILFKDGSEISAKVEEVGINEIKYRRCDLQGGPLYVAKKSEIFMIKYTNGTKELIKSEEPVVKIIPETNQGNTYKTNKYKKVNHPLALPGEVLGIMSLISGYFVILALSAMSTVTFVMFIPLVFALLAVFLCASAISGINKQPDIYKGKGIAMPGLIFGAIVALVYFIVLSVFLVLG